jgi:hypothetical protein
MSIDCGNIPAEYFGSVWTSGHRARALRLLEERDEMRMNWVLTTAVVAMSITAAVGAQSAKAMHQPSKREAMSTT